MIDPGSRDIARDYNRGLARPIRAAHVAGAVVLDLTRPITWWVLHPTRRDWALPVSLGLLALVLILPWDGAISATLQSFEVTGDVRRELHAWQQFGALGSILLVASLVWLLDPVRQRRLLDLALATGIVWGSVAVMKVLVGRPRPRDIYNDPETFLWPWGQYPVPHDDGKIALLYAWEPAAARSADLWSMPSSHAAAAAVLAVFMIALYPRIRWVAVALAAVVALCRVLFGAHWPTDVIVGAAVGVAGSQTAIGRFWGVRALDWLWRHLVNQRAEPSLPWVLKAEWSRRGIVTTGGAWGWWWQTLTDQTSAAFPPSCPALPGTPLLAIDPSETPPFLDRPGVPGSPVVEVAARTENLSGLAG